MLPCVILAGGLATRMRPETLTIPKILLPVADRPFADIQLSWLAAQGVRDVVLCIGFLGEQVSDYIGDGDRWGLRVSYVQEPPELRGTAGALRLALDLGVLPETFFVLYGDSYLTVDFAAVAQRFSAVGRPALMTVFPDPGPLEIPNAVYRDPLVVRYEKNLAERPAEMRWVDYGLSVLTAATIHEQVPSGTVHDLATVFAAMSKAGQLTGFEVTERFYEIGSPAGRAELSVLLSST